MGLSPGCSPYSLSLSSPPSPWNTPPPILGSSLPDGCEDFTLGSCNTEQDELIEKYTGIPDAPGCQALCGYIERCQHFRYTKSSQECELFHFRFLTTCNIVAGPKAPLVAACSKEERKEVPVTPSYRRIASTVGLLSWRQTDSLHPASGYTHTVW